MTRKPPKQLSDDALTVLPASAGRERDYLSILFRWAPAIILIITALVYSKALSCQLTNFDDDTFILNNPLVKDLSWDGLKAIFTSISSGKYQPLTTFTFALEYHFFGFNPIIYHLDNVLLHMASTFLVFVLTERLSRNRVTAIVVSILFAIHPMHVEEVAWASERKDMLYAVFYLLSVCYYLKYLESGFKVRYYVLMLLLFVASLLAKSEAVTLPLLLLLIDWYKSRTIDRKAIIEKLPLFAGAIVVICLSALSKQADGAIGAVNLTSYGFINRIFLFTTVPAFYLVKLVAPFSLSAMHYYPDLHDGLLPWSYYMSLPFMIGILWLVLRKSSFRKEMLFGSAFFAITICVMPQLLSVGPSLTPERYTYIPYVGFFYIVGQWMSHTSAQSKWYIKAKVLFGCFIVYFCVLSWLRIDAWKDSITLLTDTIEKNSDVADCSYLYWTRGNARIAENDLNGAVEDYTVAISQHPGYLDAYCNRGGAYFQSGNFQSAIVDYDKALRLSPHHTQTYYNRAACKASIGDFGGALSDFNTFLKMSPTDGRAYTDRGMVKFSLRDTIGAYEDWKSGARYGNETAIELLQQVVH